MPGGHGFGMTCVVMRWRFGLPVTLAPSLVLAWVCATAPEAPAMDQDPTVPELDASWAPRPGRPSAPDGSVVVAPEPEPDAGTDSAAAPAPVFPPSTPRAGRGDVVITEVMFDPTGPEPASEWFELYNGRLAARSLAGLRLKDGAGRTHVIAGEAGAVAVAPGAYGVLVRDRAVAIASGVPESAIVYEYGAGLGPGEGIQLANGTSGAITLLDPGEASDPEAEVEITSVAFGRVGFVDVEGRSAQADDSGGWTLAAATPGAPRAATR